MLFHKPDDLMPPVNHTVLAIYNRDEYRVVYFDGTNWIEGNYREWRTYHTYMVAPRQWTLLPREIIL